MNVKKGDVLTPEKRSLKRHPWHVCYRSWRQ